MLVRLVDSFCLISGDFVLRHTSIRNEVELAFVRVQWKAESSRNRIPAIDVGAATPEFCTRGLRKSTKTLNKIHNPFHSLTTHESLNMAFGKLLRTCAASMAVLGLVTAHGGGVAHQKPLQVDPEADWATRHMAGTCPSTSLFSLYHF